MKYRNTKTGAVIDAYGTIKGNGWEEVPSSSPVPDKTDESEKTEKAPVKKKATRSNTKRK